MSAGWQWLDRTALGTVTAPTGNKPGKTGNLHATATANKERRHLS